MFIENLKLSNFKNFEAAEFDFSPRINCIIGDNGVGKTNILDAIHYLAFTKSMLIGGDKHSVKNGETFFLISAILNNNDEKELISCNYIIDKKKSLSINNVVYERLAEHIGHIPIVFSNPYDANLIHLGSDIRRKFIDSIISQFDRQYLKSLIEYNKVLENRNSLLKQYFDRKFDYENLEIWDNLLCQKADYIYRKRNDFITEILPIFNFYYNKISSNNEKVNLKYVSQLHDNELSYLLKKNFEKDVRFGFSNYGIHRDDFDFMLDDEQIKKQGSQGQQKSFIIALKFAQYDYIKRKLQISPIFLLDDIFDKLDKKRVTIISELVSDENFGQIFVTDTSYSRMPKILENINIENKILNLSLI